MSNTFGKLLTLTTYGESHGTAIGGILDGCPAGIPIDFEAIQNELNRRKPGQSKIVTQEKNQMKWNFCLVSLMAKPPELLSVLLSETATNALKTTIILKTLIVRLMLITPMPKNMEIEITGWW